MLVFAQPAYGVCLKGPPRFDLGSRDQASIGYPAAVCGMFGCELRAEARMDAIAAHDKICRCACAVSEM